MNSKICTSLGQSKKLAEILPLESADCHYITQGEKSYFYSYSLSSDAIKHYDKEIKYIPCWSLTSLLDVLPKNLNIGRPSLESNYKGYYWIQYYDEFMKPNNYKTKCFNNPVDACVAMIEKLHELKML